MRFSLLRGKIFLFSVLLFCASCGDADLFDTDKWSNKVEGWEPGVTAKVAHGSFTLWDIINQGEDGAIVKEGNNLIIQYLKPDIYHINVDQVFKMPNQDVAFTKDYEINSEFVLGEPLSQPIEIKDLSISSEIQDIPEGCVVRKLVASTTLTLPVLGFNYHIEAEFPGITKGGQPFKINQEVEATGDEITLEEIELTLGEDNKVDLNISKIEIPVGTTLYNKQLALNFGMNDLEFIKVEGKIKVAPIEIEAGNFDMDVDFLNDIGGDFKFTEPELSIILRNKGIGVPLNVVATFDGKSDDGEELTLKLKENHKLVTLGNITDVEVPDTLKMEASNSNIVDFLSLPPQGDISYRGWVYVNEDNKEDNVVYHDGEIGLDAYVRIPFSLSAERLSYKDTLNDIDIDQKYADKIKEGVIKIIATNGLPLNMEIPTLKLMNEQGEILEALSAVKGKDLLKAAGNAPVQSTIEFKINSDQAKKLGQTEDILLEIVASTPNNESYTIYADATLSFDLVIEAQAVLDDLDDL